MDYAVNNERYFVILGLNCEKNKKWHYTFYMKKVGETCKYTSTISKRTLTMIYNYKPKSII